MKERNKHIPFTNIYDNIFWIKLFKVAMQIKNSKLAFDNWIKCQNQKIRKQS